MKVIVIEVNGCNTKLYEDGIQIPFVKDFCIQGGVDSITTLRINKFLIDESTSK